MIILEFFFQVYIGLWVMGTGLCILFKTYLLTWLDRKSTGNKCYKNEMKNLVRLYRAIQIVEDFQRLIMDCVRLVIHNQPQELGIQVTTFPKSLDFLHKLQ